MKVVAKQFNELNAKEVFDILRVRQDVFVEEQKITETDADDMDFLSIHMYHRGADEKIDAYLRMYEDEKEPGVISMGRILTTKRGDGLGAAIMKEAMDYARQEMGARELRMNAQQHAIGFYEKLGFRITSEGFMEAGVPHIEMRYRFPD